MFREVVEVLDLETAIEITIENVDGDAATRTDATGETPRPDFQELESMSMGVDRAVVIDHPLPPNVDNVVDRVQENRRRIPPFYRDHLEAQGVLPKLS